MLKRRFILLILFAIGVLCSMSVISLLLYFDPYAYRITAIVLLILSFIGAGSSIFSLILYFIKKIYYRGEVGIYHILTSLRQSFFISVLFLGIVAIIAFGIPMFLPIILLIVSIVFLELFIQSF